MDTITKTKTDAISEVIDAEAKTEKKEELKAEAKALEERAKIFLYPSLQTIIHMIREGGKKEWDKKNFIVKTICDEIYPAMESIGGVKFFYDDNDYYIFHKQNKLVIRIDKKERDFRAFIFSMGINPADELINYVIEGLIDTARNYGREVELKRLIHYCAETRTLYIKNGSGIVKITKNSIERVDNGTDDVYFINERENQPFEIDENVSENLVQKILIGSLKFEVDNLIEEETRFVLEAWIYSLFFEEIQPTKPIPTLWGEKGSGKSLFFQKVGSFLTGKKYDVSPLTNDERDMQTSLINNRFFFIDNADRHYPWLANALAMASTGQRIRLRKLFENSEELSYPVHCFVGITSRTPSFNRDDVCDRILLCRVRRFANEEFIGEDILLKELFDNRNKLWGYVIKRLQMILADLEAPPPHSCSFRMADFYNFVHQISKTINPNIKVKELFKKLEEEQNTLFRDGDVLSDLLEEWLSNENNLGREVGTSELFVELKAICEQKGDNFLFKSASGFGKALVNTIPLFKGTYKITCQKGAGRKKIYLFKRFDAVSKACELFGGKIVS